MSLGYAEKLSYRSDLGGQVGAQEFFDSPEELSRKTDELARLIKEAKKVVVFTGAGISTSCGIPDFRGPNGIWTLQRAKKPLPKLKTSFTFAKPSLTHMALVALHRAGKLSYICSQNVDSLHVRSGIPRECLAELHGNSFSERCPKCSREYIRDFEMDTVGFKRTGRSCVSAGCNGRLKDHILDWENALPEDELQASEQHAADADLAICLGTSLQIVPACNIPIETVKSGGKLVIVNLQKTPKDKKASLLIRGRSDEVMKAVMEQLGTPIPSFIRQDAVLLVLRQSPAKRNRASSILPFSVQVSSCHGWRCSIPILNSVEISFPDHASLKPAVIRKHPFTVRRSVPDAPCHLRVRCTLHLAETVESCELVQQVDHAFDITDAEGLGRLDEPSDAGSAFPLALWPESERLNVQVKVMKFNTQAVHYGGGRALQDGKAPSGCADQANGSSLLPRSADGDYDAQAEAKRRRTEAPSAC
mmetsp:Transcript_37356/g.105395  ORF Transcript_37356/g.105395 Transcript_37356/m.105395 type:complete len:475 (-) Transcript_37356:369-1793(-)|eukprot:CAMPEP_0117650876 /NCGR_PEP_ID=MMETSP0804-20121206/1778_1 /TAXON_ID=1074897 /ORGANISM="Tetraselmis astigmatica, Strain CCMP880" /LENGTH=474 /DNA_ID=CAMNT_0005456787 /DNA_START=63 /DNA_END=1487 /DNA_ORIENTATION=+